MKGKRQNHKINDIINLSQNYKLHRMYLDTARPTINSNNNKKKQESIKKLTQQKLRYRQAIRDYNNTCLKRQNQRIINRITRISEQRDHKRSLQSQRLRQSKLNLSPYNPQRTLSRSSSKSTYNRQNSNSKLDNSKANNMKSRKVLKSMSSSRSLSSISSNYRQRTLRQKEIDRQNVKIAARITNPKSIRTLALDQLNKSYQRQQEYSRIRSRFSERNQQIVKSLAMQGLKLDKKDVQYLPQLTTKRLKSKQKIETAQKIQWNSNLK